jgi:hypothetical protein
MVPSYAITIAIDGECLMCGGFPLGETVHLGNFKFIANYFGGLSLSPRRGDTCAAFVGSPHSGASTSRRAMIEDSAREFLMTSTMEGSSVPPLSEGGTQGFCLLLSQPHHG